MSQQPNILIVDDDRSTQRVLADALTKQGFIVTVERDGEWAVKTFEKKQFDAVVLDVLLPALNGYEVAKAMREIPQGKRVPIIMISGVYKNAIHQREAVQKHGAYAFLEKPIDLKRLSETLRQALGERFPQPEPPRPPPPPTEEDDVTGEYMADENQREEVQVVERQAKKVQATTSQLTATGDFAQKPFAEVLAEIYRWRATGALLIRRGKVKKIVYFRDGTPELVKSNLLVECLGRILVREKMISEAECAESLKRMKATKRMQGTVLIEMGCISPHNLQYALHVQLADKLYDAFRWDEGEYQFNPKVTLPPEPISLAITCAQLIHEGVKRAYDEKRLAKAFAGVEQLYVHPIDEPLYALQEAGLADEERELLLMADGHKTVGTLRALEVLSSLDTDRLLFAMKCAQMIELRPGVAQGRPRVSFAEVAAAARAAEERAAPPPPPEPTPPPPQLPPPLPPSLPPPLPVARVIAPADPPLELPWKDAALAQPMARPPAPPEPRQFEPREPPARPAPPVPPEPLGSLLPELSDVHVLPRLTTEESHSRERLAARVAAMRKLDYFEVLGVKRAAGREEIKRAYFTLAREYHPDRHFQGASGELRAMAQQLYDLISTAHDTLTDPGERTRYLAELDQGIKHEEDEDVGRILAAEGKFQRGEELMRQRQFADAYRLFGDAISLYEDEGEFHAWKGWALFQADPEKSEDALRSIERAISLNPKLDKSYLFLGYIHKATGRPDRAEKQFEKAMHCNPDCTEALRELRLLGRARK